MKKIYFLTLTYLFLSLLINAQSTYYKMLKEDTTTWQHFDITFGVQQRPALNSTPVVNGEGFAALDTISFNGVLYKKFYQVCCHPFNFSNKYLVGYLREDTVARKVYYRSSAATWDQLIYDFSTNINDSINLQFPNISMSGYFWVDSIVIKNTTAGPRKHFYYRKHQNNSNPNTFYYEHIEGVGCTYNVAYLFAGYYPGAWSSSFPYSPTCHPKWNIGLTCKRDDNALAYQGCVMTNTNSMFVIMGNPNGCDFGYFIPGSLKSNDWENLVKIGPNPSNDQIEVSVGESFSDIKCSVTDMTGKVLLSFPKSVMNTEKNSFIFSSRDLAPGVYIVQVDLNGTLIKRPVIIQH